MSNDGSIIENMDLSHIHLAVIDKIAIIFVIKTYLDQNAFVIRRKFRNMDSLS
jgi:hypothetical protein